jgi:hypothetical protein
MEHRMITLTRLLNKSIFGILVYSSFVSAETTICPKDFNILIRDSKEGYSFVSKKLDDLYCGNKFEGKYFKIVQGTSDEAIEFDNQDPKLIKKAANVYFHLTQARNYWTNEIKSAYVETLPQIIIRLDITNSFSSVRHFKNAELEKNNNNAWSIPNGQEPGFLHNPKSWEKEIWFSPMKKIETRSLLTSEGNNPVHQSLILIKDPLIDFNENSLIYTGLSLTVAPPVNQSYLLQTAVTNLGMLAILYGSVEVTKYMDKLFVEKYYYIETAMIPEIIYHEYAHIAMSDHLKTVHSVPVIEGMADYFASRVAKREKMYEKMDDFSTNRFKDINNKSLYSPYLEGAWNATSDFSLSLLWKGKKEFDIINSKRILKGQPMVADFDQLVFRAHFELDETSNIETGLTKALVNSCKENCESVRAGVNTLQYVFESKGMN